MIGMDKLTCCRDKMQTRIDRSNSNETKDKNDQQAIRDSIPNGGKY